jgi:hypothetical protein
MLEIPQIVMDGLKHFDDVNGISDFLEFRRLPDGRYVQGDICCFEPSPWKLIATFQRTNGVLMPLYQSKISGRLHFGERPQGEQ